MNFAHMLKNPELAKFYPSITNALAKAATYKQRCLIRRTVRFLEAIALANNAIPQIVKGNAVTFAATVFAVEGIARDTRQTIEHLGGNTYFCRVQAPTPGAPLYGRVLYRDRTIVARKLPENLELATTKINFDWMPTTR